ncbi:tyrosine-type recombinase/integrase [Aneurinibacillus thermoaerophilus]|uniref:site-specific integrase n=1 Tax=Aneurinibacillus thermoaerophilus TaxID=143495 RepID=UPI002E1E5FB8|nr:tyrosine-type recombinase/integrase [Aneurinibacillus thermoaerophilus]MED0736727.1 tyrosine-type recombinase/integrase [Aneurinibacillus thermoaerophilus]
MKGYFRKRGTKWSFTIDVGRDPETGKRKQKTVSGFKTKKEAEKACAEMIAQIENGEFFETSKDSFAVFLQQWLDNAAKQTTRATTFDGYKRTIHHRIIPAIGHLKLADIKPIHIQKFYTQLVEEDLSSEYIRFIHSILRSAFNTALKWQLVSKNIMSNVEVPKLKRKEKGIWTLEQAQQFLNYAKEKGTRRYIVYLLAIYTGMRRGEIFGLRWKDVDLENGKISINQTLSWVSGQGLIFQEAKTKRSHRSISISDFVVQELKNHKLQQRKEKLRIGEAYNDQDLVVASAYGNPMNPRGVTDYFRKLTVEAGLPVIRFHDLRHTHATIMLKLGEHPKIVSERLGHSNIQMTLNLYSHVTPDMQKDASHRFEEAMKSAQNSL